MSESKIVPENLKWDGEEALKFMNKRSDPRFGEITIYKNERTGRKVMLKEKSSGDKEQFAKDIRMAQERAKISNKNVHQLLGWGTSTQKGLCSTHHHVKMFFDYPDSDLRNEAAQHKKIDQQISDGELSWAVSNALSGLGYIHERGLAHGDIRPELISAVRMGGSEDFNHSVLLDRLNDPSGIEKTQQNNMVNKKNLFMSPQLYKRINTKGKVKPEFNRQKNDLFALGLSIIGVGNIKSTNDCYGKKGEFNVENLNGHLEEFKARYADNRPLCNVVENLVRLDEKERPDTTSAQVLGQGLEESLPPIEYNEVVVNAGPYKRTVETVVNSRPVGSGVHEYIEADKNSHFVREGEHVVYGKPRVVRTYVDESSRRDYKGNEPSNIRVQSALPPVQTVVRTEYVNSKPQQYVQVNSTPQTYIQQRIVTPTYTEVKSTPAPQTQVIQANNQEASRPSKSPKNREYTISQKRAIQFHDLKFESQISETDPENRFEQPVMTRKAYHGENMEDFPTEGRVVRKRVKVVDAEGNIIEEYDEPVQ